MVWLAVGAHSLRTERGRAEQDSVMTRMLFAEPEVGPAAASEGVEWVAADSFGIAEPSGEVAETFRDHSQAASFVVALASTAVFNVPINLATGTRATRSETPSRCVPGRSGRP